MANLGTNCCARVAGSYQPRYPPRVALPVSSLCAASSHHWPSFCFTASWRSFSASRRAARHWAAVALGLVLRTRNRLHQQVADAQLRHRLPLVEVQEDLRHLALRLVARDHACP